MNYMDKKVTFQKREDSGNFTYITPNSIITTHEKLTKDVNHKTN